MDLFKIVGKIAVENDEANRAIDETTDKAESGSNSMVESFKKIGTAVATYLAVDKIIEFGKSIVEASATVSAEQSAFEQIMGDYSQTAMEKMGEVADATGVVDTRLTGYMTSLTAKFKGLGFDIDEATTLASDGLMLASDASAFWDKSLEDSMSALNSFINGSYEGGEAIGLFANDTQMASYAVEQGIVSQTKEWANLDEATKQATRLEYAQNMKTIVEYIKTNCPQADIILGHGPYTNPEVGRAAGFEYMDSLNEMLDQYGAELYKLEEDGVVIADLCKIDGYLLQRKRFADMTGNNINHNNDFKARVVAQTFVKTIEIEK